ncbi:MAG: glycosyltransferase family 39 protein [Candidatus Roizmanbacteria bacterium]
MSKLNKYLPVFKKYLPLFFFILIIGGLWIRSITLSSVPFFEWDESIYAQVAREWLRHPGLTLHYNGSLWFEKPPLLFAVIGILFQIFGASEFIARLPSVFAAICCVVLIYQIIGHITKNTFAQIAGMLLFASTPFFIDRASIVNVDIFLTLGWLLYVCDGTFASKFIGTIVGVWTKSFLGLFPLCADIALSIYYHSVTQKKIREWVVIALVSLAWHIIMLAQYTDQFISSHIKDHLISRVTTPIELHFGGKFFYIEKLWENYPLLLAVAAIGVLLWIFMHIKRYDTKNADVLFLLPLAYFVLLTVGKSKLSWYIMPALPFISIWIIFALQHISRRFVQNLCYVGLILWSGSMVAQQTYGFTITNPRVPQQVSLARCQQYMPPFTRVAYLVSPTQRKDAQVIEAAQVAIASSFIYGSAPSFVFYIDKPVTFFYKPVEFLNHVHEYDAFAMHIDDTTLLGEGAQKAFTPHMEVITECERGDWILYSRDTVAK